MTMIWAERRARLDQLCTGHGLSFGSLRGLVRTPGAVAGGAVLVGFVVLAAVGPLLAAGDGLLPSMLVAARPTLAVAVAATLVGFVFGTFVGVLACVCGGAIDAFVMRCTDALLVVPGLLIAIAVAALAPASMILAVGVVGVPVFARLTRGSLMAQRASAHVLAAITRGIPPMLVVVRHVLPGAIAPVLVQVPLALGAALLDVAVLAVLGFTTDRDWGSLLAQAQQHIGTQPVLAVAPAAAIITVVLGCTLLGESLRAALDVRQSW